jgi:Zinc finger, C2H2 type
MICSTCSSAFTVIQSFKDQMLKVDADYFQPQKELKRKQQEEKLNESFQLMKKNLNEIRKTASSETSDNTTIVQENHQCTVCFKYYYSKQVLRNHVKNVHAENGTSCDWCDAKFANMGNLSIHMKAEHERIYNSYCKFCEQWFSSKHVLDTHIKRIHLQTEFRCYRCGKKFREKVILKEHLEKHKIHKEMKSSCVVCKKSFMSSFHLAVHTRTKHSKTRDFKCEICERSFLLKTNLQCHMRVHWKNDKTQKL